MTPPKKTPKAAAAAKVVQVKEAKETRNHVAALMVAGFVFLGMGNVANYFFTQHQKHVEDYKRCLSANINRTLINMRFDARDKVLASFGDPKDPRTIDFLARNKKLALPIEDCEKNPVPDPLETVYPKILSPRPSASPNGTVR